MDQSGGGAIPERPDGSMPAPPAWTPAPPPAAAAPYGRAVTNGTAEAALVLGILGLTLLPLLASIVGLVLGYVAKGQIDRSGGRETGRGLAVAGIVLGWIGIGCSIVVMALFFWLLNLDSYRG